VKARPERLVALHAAFGFTVQDLAAVLGITGQQLYKWLDDANEVELHEATYSRLAAVERIAQEWTSRSAAPLRSVSRETLANDVTVLAMLTADAIDEAEVVAVFDQLVANLPAKPKTRSQRLSEAGFTRRASARSLPSDD
jgi:hypothetical protein